MPTNLFRTERHRGLRRLHCPTCGDALLDPVEGLAGALCVHVVLFRDWVGEDHGYDPERASSLGRDLDERIEEHDTPFADALAEALPDAMILAIDDPGWGPHSGSSIAFALTLE